MLGRFGGFPGKPIVRLVRPAVARGGLAAAQLAQRPPGPKVWGAASPLMCRRVQFSVPFPFSLFPFPSLSFFLSLPVVPFHSLPFFPFLPFPFPFPFPFPNKKCNINNRKSANLHKVHPPELVYADSDFS